MKPEEASPDSPLLHPGEFRGCAQFIGGTLAIILAWMALRSALGFVMDLVGGSDAGRHDPVFESWLAAWLACTVAERRLFRWDWWTLAFQGMLGIPVFIFLIYAYMKC